MISVLLIHPRSENLSDGIATHCNILYELFRENKTVSVIKPENYSFRNIRLFNGLFKFRELYSSIKNSGAQIVHIHGYTTLQVGQAIFAAALCKKKIVYSPHWHPFSELRRPFLAKCFFNIALRPLIRLFVTDIVCINKEDSNYFAHFKKNVYTIPHCLFLDRRNIIERKIKENNKKKSLLFVGRFDATNKGVDYFWKLPEGKYEIRMVGNGSIKPRSDMRIYRNIPKEDLYELYCNSDIVVIPSQYEAFSLVALEALSMGTPVVMSDKVRIADYLNGLDCISIFKYGDFNGFCQAIENSDNLKVDISKINDIFSPQSVSRKYTDLYCNAL